MISADTIAAISTAIGESSIGVIRFSGPQAISILQQGWRSPSMDWSKVPARQAQVGVFGDESTTDQVVAILFRAPHSYTGEDTVELSAHGNPHLLQQLLKVALAFGARLARPGEFTERAFLNGKMDLAQAEAVADLIHAKSSRAQQAAQKQLKGHLSQRVRKLRDRLLPLIAHIEVGLDHSDEDHDFLKSKELVERCAQVEKEIELLLDSTRVGKLLREGLRIAIIGKPNVGKSSLLNALLKEDRAIVTPIAGTTRDTVEETLNWNGLPVVLIDTAGIHLNPSDVVEEMGIERSKSAMESADLTLCVFDASRPFTQEDEDVLTGCPSDSTIVVLNKFDLPKQCDKTFSLPTISVSAKSGIGLNELASQVQDVALPKTATSQEAEWLLNARHADALKRAYASLERARGAAEGQPFEECVALELKLALDALGEIIGETTTDEILGQIFSQFCVGK